MARLGRESRRGGIAGVALRARMAPQLSTVVVGATAGDLADRVSDPPEQRREMRTVVGATAHEVDGDDLLRRLDRAHAMLLPVPLTSVEDLQAGGVDWVRRRGEGLKRSEPSLNVDISYTSAAAG